MIVDVINLIEFETHDFEFELDTKLLEGVVDNMEYLTPIVVSGSYQLVDDNTFTVDANIEFLARHRCDLCLIEHEYEVCIRLYEAFTKDESTDYIITKDNYVDIGEAAREKIILRESGKKRLCIKDCKGLCPQCGTNLNTEKCNCKVEKEENKTNNPFAMLKDKFNTGGH